MKIKNIIIQNFSRPDQAPDIDLDFEANRREDVKKHIYEKYGLLYTCSIGSYTRLKLKAGIKDLGRARGIDYQTCNIASKVIDNQLEYTWKDLFQNAINHKSVRKFIQDYPDVVHCIKHSLGQARSASVHASAVVIVPKMDNNKVMNIFNWMPIRKINDVYVSEWEGKYCERAGFLKEDILSLSQLDKLKKMIELIKRNYDIDIDLNSIPLDEKGVYDLFKKGYNEDVFQFNSKGLKSYSKLVGPDNFEDLVAMNALYRPGAMKSNAHIDYAKFKHEKKQPVIDYGMEEVTKDTQGLYIYQETMMRALMVGGLSAVDSDVARSAIKKFDKVKMAEFKDRFVKGYCDLLRTNNIFPENLLMGETEKVWSKLMAFSSYGFNKCITPDSVIKTIIGDVILKDLIEKIKFEKIKLISYDFQNDLFFEQELKEIHDNGYQEVFEIELDDGIILKATGNHQFLTINGYKTVCNLTENDEIIEYEEQKFKK